MRLDRSLNYPSPPWTYTGARVLNVACRAENADELNLWLPDAFKLRFADGTFVLWFASVPSIPELGSDYCSTECGIVLPVTTAVGGHTGATFALMIVDNDMALAGGREIWGYPKKLGMVSFREEGEGNVIAEARHHAYRDKAESMIVNVRATADGRGEDISALIASLEPRYLERIECSPYEERPRASEVVRVAHRDAKIHRDIKCVSAEVKFGHTAEAFDRLGQIDVHGASFKVVDFVLPYAQRLEADK